MGNVNSIRDLRCETVKKGIKNEKWKLIHTSSDIEQRTGVLQTIWGHNHTSDIATTIKRAENRINKRISARLFVSVLFTLGYISCAKRGSLCLHLFIDTNVKFNVKIWSALSFFCFLPFHNTKRNVLCAHPVPFQNVIFMYGVFGGVWYVFMCVLHGLCFELTPLWMVFYCVFLYKWLIYSIFIVFNSKNGEKKVIFVQKQ